VTRHIDWYAYEIPALVRGNRMFRHRALLDEQHDSSVVMVAQGPPRVWQRGLDAAVAGISASIAAGEWSAEPLLAAAASRVRAAEAALVDENVIQVHALAISFEGYRATVALAGSCRAYLHRGDENRRLSPKSDAKGLRNAYSFSTNTHDLEVGDVVVIGPSHLFSVAGVAALARVLYSHPDASPRQIAHNLISASGAEGTGGAVLVFRVS
jgi:hypothetical protein